MAITDEPTIEDLRPVVRHTDETEGRWFLNGLMTTLATGAETGEAYCLMEHRLTAACNSPVHRHEVEDEAFYVLDGELEIAVDGQSVVAGPGCFALVPRGVLHGFAVRSATARVLVIVSGSDVPGGGLERFFAVAGVPAPVRALPEPSAPDPGALTAIADVHGIVIAPPS